MPADVYTDENPEYGNRPEFDEARGLNLPREDRVDEADIHVKPAKPEELPSKPEEFLSKPEEFAPYDAKAYEAPARNDDFVDKPSVSEGEVPGPGEDDPVPVAADPGPVGLGRVAMPGDVLDERITDAPQFVEGSEEYLGSVEPDPNADLTPREIWATGGTLEEVEEAKAERQADAEIDTSDSGNPEWVGPGNSPEREKARSVTASAFEAGFAAGEADDEDRGTGPYEDRTVAQLQAVARSRDLPVSGTKDELVERLRG